MNKRKPKENEGFHVSKREIKPITVEKRRKIDQRRQAAMERAIGAFFLALLSGGEE